MDLHEVLLYDTALTDEQIERISSVLMAKWGIPNQAAVAPTFANPLPTGTWVVGANSALSLVGYSQSLDTLVFDAGGYTRAPELLVDGPLDIRGTTLRFLNSDRVGPGDFLYTTGALTGPFAAVEGQVSGVRYGERSACIVGGMVIILR